MKKLMAVIMLALLAASLGWAQGEDRGQVPLPPDPPPQDMMQGSSVSGHRYGMGVGGTVHVMRKGGPMMGMMGGRFFGKWWKNPVLAQRLGLTDDQVSKMEKVFQDHRLQLIDLHAALEKQEVLLEPMINADHPDEQQTLAQIDKVAQARANLEKSNARMLFAIRNVLTPEQWKKLQAERARSTFHRERGFRTERPGRQGGMIQRRAPVPPDAPTPPPQPSAPSESNLQQ
jgi:periplasmic protein CpxP/Spy